MAFLKACSQSVSCDKQELVARATGCPKSIPPTYSRSSGHLKNDSMTFFLLSFFDPPFSDVILANAAAVTFVLLRNSSFNFHCYTQRETTPADKSDWKWQLPPFATSCMKAYEGHSLVQTSPVGITQMIFLHIFLFLFLYFRLPRGIRRSEHRHGAYIFPNCYQPVVLLGGGHVHIWRSLRPWHGTLLPGTHVKRHSGSVWHRGTPPPHTHKRLRTRIVAFEFRFLT